MSAKEIKRFILVQDNGEGSYVELDQTNNPNEANRLARYYEGCNVGKVTILSSYTDQKLRISKLNQGERV